MSRLYNGNNNYIEHLIELGAESINLKLKTEGNRDIYLSKYGESPLINFRAEYFNSLFNLHNKKPQFPHRLHQDITQTQEDRYFEFASDLANMVHELILIPGFALEFPKDIKLNKAVSHIIDALEEDKKADARIKQLFL